MSSLLRLPPVPKELKSVVPFLQRADELEKQESIISYWCAYYAAQVGISIKARDHLSREFLYDLLGVLEKMKADIGPHDAMDIEGVSFAYVENFALKVFLNADNEDRNNGATRSTAKKFLAAANFLEILNIFPNTFVSDSTEEKIRYAKWKAADIAKAFREGRKPVAGPPGWVEECERLQLLQSEQEGPSTFRAQAGPQEPVSPINDSKQHNLPSRSHHADVSSFQNIREHESLVLPHDSSGSGAHTIDALSGSARGTLKKPAWTNEELEGVFTPPLDAETSFKPYSDKSSPPQNEPRRTVPPPPEEYNGPTQKPYPSSSQGVASYSSVPPPSPPSQLHHVSPSRGYSPPFPQAGVFELTPEIVAKVQKRCRHAISALDYEDSETARKELCAALALLEI